MRTEMDERSYVGTLEKRQATAQKTSGRCRQAAAAQEPRLRLHRKRGTLAPKKLTQFWHSQLAHIYYAASLQASRLPGLWPALYVEF